jgi:hypothetical protein
MAALVRIRTSVVRKTDALERGIKGERKQLEPFLPQQIEQIADFDIGSTTG